MNLADLRRDYNLHGLRRADLAPEPFAQFQRWFEEAEQAIGKDANAMTLATVSPEGQPSVRIVLLKGLDLAKGLQFFTNYESDKCIELDAQPRAALIFQWLALDRQVCIKGVASKCSEEESRSYFQSRPRASQLAAWTSKQSRVVADRATMDAWLAEKEAHFEGKDPLPLPPFWGGYWVVPTEVEFWQGRAARFHDRMRYRRTGDEWLIERLSP